jgi:hypothetical protein
MIDHLVLRVPQSKYGETVAFYVTSLAPLGYKKLKEYPTATSLGEGEKPDFTIVAKGEALGNIHFSFGAKGKLLVVMFMDYLVYMLSRSSFDQSFL